MPNRNAFPTWEMSPECDPPTGARSWVLHVLCGEKSGTSTLAISRFGNAWAWSVYTKSWRQTSFHNKYWMNGGFLLGCVRDGKPIPNDKDVDFSYWDTDREHLQAGLSALKEAGFQLIPPRTNNDGSVTLWSTYYQQIKYEFFEMHCVDGKMRWFSHAWKPPTELLNEVPNHGLSELEFFGCRWMKPDDHETYLESLFGDWRTPNPNYHYLTDSRAVIARSPWQGG